MSDQSPASGPPADEEDEGLVRPSRQSAAERRSSETVMIDSNNLDDLVAKAKDPADAAPAAAAPSAPTASAPPADTDAESDADAESRSIVLIVGVAVIIVLAGIIAYLIYLAD